MFSDLRKGRAQVLEDFIKCYQTETCLWNTKSKEYHDKVKKHAAYAKLLRIYKILEPRADRITLVKKINILRTNHRKEMKKVEESKRSGNGIYVPRLWYYHLFDFLEDQKNLTTNCNVNVKHDGFAEQQIEVYVDETSVSQDSHSSNITHNDVNLTGALHGLKNVAYIQNPQPPHLTSLDLQIPQVKPDKRSSPDDGGHVIYREQENNSKKSKWGDDRYQLFATNVTLKMKDIQNDTQRLLAEKMINEALFMAEMGQLSMSHSISLTQNYYNPQPVYVGRSEFSYHNACNIRPQTSAHVTNKEMVMTPPDCTSHYENEERNESFNCRSCGRPNSPSIEENEDFKDPLLSKN